MRSHLDRVLDVRSPKDPTNLVACVNRIIFSGVPSCDYADKLWIGRRNRHAIFEMGGEAKGEDVH